MIVGSASAVVAADVQHGISFTKGCASPTQIGQPYTCTYSIRNNIDEAQDTLDDHRPERHGAERRRPRVAPGNVFSSLRFEIGAFEPGFSTPPTCTGIRARAPCATRSRARRSCTLPFGSRLNVLPFSFYTVTAADFGLPGHVLTDSAELTWHDLCNDPAGTGNSNCVPEPAERRRRLADVDHRAPLDDGDRRSTTRRTLR